MLAARSTAEIIAADNHRRRTIGALVKHEIRLLGAVLGVAHLVEQVLAETGALDGFEEVLRDDHICVDVDHVHRRRDAAMLGELIHG